jgi:hypothetical protein
LDWNAPVDLYCERVDPSFWAEPVNALSNAAFLIAAAAACAQWRGRGRDWPALALILLTAAVGIGSFIFHTFATRGAALFDTIPIALFIYGYFLLALRRFLGLSFVWTLVLLGGFFALSQAVAAMVPRGFLNGSHYYLPALAALLAIGALASGATRRTLLLAGGVFAGSIAFRSVDLAVCDALPLGTHFLWHGLNGVVLYLLLRAAISAKQTAPALTSPAAVRT